MVHLTRCFPRDNTLSLQHTIIINIESQPNHLIKSDTLCSKEARRNEMKSKESKAKLRSEQYP